MQVAGVHDRGAIQSVREQRQRLLSRADGVADGAIPVCVFVDDRRHDFRQVVAGQGEATECVQRDQQVRSGRCACICVMPQRNSSHTLES